MSPDPAGARPSVPGYELLGSIAGTGTVEVYRARNLALGHEVATKVLRPGFATPDTSRRFIRGARINAQLHHPGIPPVHDLGALADGRPFLVMKLIQGRTLAQILRERESHASELPRLIRVFEQAARVVAYAHDRRVIHRDIKPGNVMIGAFGEVLVLSWGLATSLDDPERPSVLGTPLYMPPEQARGEPADGRSDVFGLGGILCHILTGGAPFRGEGMSDLLTLSAAGNLAETFARLDACGADPELVALAKRCLSPDPADRPADAGEVARAVAAYRTATED